MDVSQEVTELGVVELLVGFDTHAVEEFIEIYVFGIDLETELSHDHLQFVFELLVLDSVLFEVSLKDRVHEYFIPAHSVFLVNL